MITGVSLPDLCEQQRSHPDCNMIELLSSSGAHAHGPVGSEAQHLFSAAPAPFSF